MRRTKRARPALQANRLLFKIGPGYIIMIVDIKIQLAGCFPPLFFYCAPLTLSYSRQSVTYKSYMCMRFSKLTQFGMITQEETHKSPTRWSKLWFLGSQFYYRDWNPWSFLKGKISILHTLANWGFVGNDASWLWTEPLDLTPHPVDWWDFR